MYRTKDRTIRCVHWSVQPPDILELSLGADQEDADQGPTLETVMHIQRIHALAACQTWSRVLRAATSAPCLVSESLKCERRGERTVTSIKMASALTRAGRTGRRLQAYTLLHSESVAPIPNFASELEMAPAPRP